MDNFYEYGDLKVEMENLKDLLINKMGIGEYSTNDILTAYKTTYENDAQTALDSSWTEYFEEILKQCEGRTEGKIIKQIKDNNVNHNAQWKVY
ncbi:hypothetical protein [Clostridium brassicae]|uniref:Uncharacterized protein n=1 Tax=Clostridium brassicae TaxID=2999072 RepID=A0ABT4DCI7_9CLOT|nr:hypothetical protein [Clostridium brassicae]MCY6960026.1 hypothetical protein [Clostridium brassicae]